MPWIGVISSEEQQNICEHSEFQHLLQSFFFWQHFQKTHQLGQALSV